MTPPTRNRSLGSGSCGYRLTPALPRLDSYRGHPDGGTKARASGAEDPTGVSGVRWKVNVQRDYGGWKMIRELLVTTAITAAAIGVAPTASAGPIEQLWGMLPPGYGPDSCHPVEDQLAAVLECPGGNSLPGGPTGGRYLLFRDLGELQKSYDVAVNEPTRPRVPCEEGLPAAAIRWNDAHDGWLFCSTEGDHAHVIWSRESTLFSAHVMSHDLASLVQWWKNAGYKAG